MLSKFSLNTIEEEPNIASILTRKVLLSLAVSAVGKLSLEKCGLARYITEMCSDLQQHSRCMMREELLAYCQFVDLASSR